MLADLIFQLVFFYSEFNKFHVTKDRDIPDAGKHVNNLTEMGKLLEEYQTELEALNFEEKLFKWELSQFPMLFQIRQLKDPYDSLWMTFAKFQTSENLWMKGELYFNKMNFLVTIFLNILTKVLFMD